MTEVFRNGLDELKRRWQRRSLKKQLARHDAARADGLGQLGQHAARSGIDLSRHAALRDEIRRLDGTAGGIADKQKTLEAELVALTDRRQAEVAKYDAQRAEIQARKDPVDGALATARKQQSQCESDMRTLQSRLDALARESPAAIGLEQPKLDSQLESARAALPPIASDVSRLSSESQQLAAQLKTVAAEREKALHAIDADIRAARSHIQATTTSAKDIERERWTRFVDLGTALYTSGTADAGLTPLAAAVAAEDASRASTQAAFDASMAQTQAMPPNTLRNFAAISLLVVLIVFGLPAAMYSGWQAWSARQAERRADAEYAKQVDPPILNPFLEHDLKTAPPYVLANRLTDAKTEQDAQAALLDLFRAIGVGVYTPTGKQILAGAERSEKDFFLYDFQFRTLARTQVVPSYIEFAEFSKVLGEAITKFKIPEVLQMVLAPAIAKRYREAVDKPADPTSFLVLFLDGLARREPQPYSLSNFGSSGTDHIQISPVQSILILLEFFMPPDRPRQASVMPWLSRLEPRAYAARACDGIKSDTGKKLYGLGLAGVSEAAEEAFFLDKANIGSSVLHEGIKKVAEVFDGVTGILEAAGDLLTLYGIDIRVEAIPNLIHLRHTQTDVDGVITATVTFDPGQVDEDIIDCGWMAGKQMPKKGGMPGVEVSWNFAPALQPHLAMHPKAGITSAGSEGLKSTTDSAGMAYFPLMASPCPDLSGRVVGQDYMAIVTARVLTTNIPSPTMITTGKGGSPGGLRPTLGATLPRVFLKFGPGMIEYFMRGRKGYTRFRAEWHTKRPSERQYKKPGSRE
ncbi:MAG TPA: hypothetical protein VES67_24505 [Vicinamibacterales bacterium]|nr:hypothetical protein [Vicinamibacterales bacterium]